MEEEINEQHYEEDYEDFDEDIVTEVEQNQKQKATEKKTTQGTQKGKATKKKTPINTNWQVIEQPRVLSVVDPVTNKVMAQAQDETTLMLKLMVLAAQNSTEAAMGLR